MMGLVKKYLTAGRLTPVKILIYMAFTMVLGLVIRTPDWYSMIVFAMPYGFATHFILQFACCTVSKTDFLTPVKAAHVELARYMAFLIVVAWALAGAVGYTLAGYLSGVMLNMNTVAFDLLGIVGLLLLTGSILFPMVRLFSGNRTHLTQIAVYTLAVIGFVSLNLVAGNAFNEDATSVPIVILAAALFAGSYFLSLAIYRRKLRTKGVLS